MAGEAHDSDRIMTAAGQALARPRGNAAVPVGRGAAAIRRRARMARMKRILIAVAAIVAAAMGFGLFVSALGFEGLVLTVLAIVVVTFVLARYPRTEIPTPDNLDRGDLQQAIARTELWLESRKPALPAPAVGMIDRISVQLDGLGDQLRKLDEGSPAAIEMRRLVTRHLPEIVESYTTIPANLRREERAGSTPDRQLTDGLTRISAEIDSATRMIAEGALDQLAVQARYLDYRYGDETAALPDPEKRKP